jgi:hypothetical protein
MKGASSTRARPISQLILSRPYPSCGHSSCGG